MISPISSIAGAVTYASHARSNANFLTQYTNFADSFYAAPSNPAPAAPAAGDQPVLPYTRALGNPRWGAFNYLRGLGRSGNSTGAQSQSAVFRSSAQAAAEVPIMPPMARAGEQLAAIHDDARDDNPIQANVVHRTVIPGGDSATREGSQAQPAPMPARAKNDDVAVLAMRGRDRAMSTIFRNATFEGANSVYRAFSGIYAAA